MPCIGARRCAHNTGRAPVPGQDGGDKMTSNNTIEHVLWFGFVLGYFAAGYAILPIVFPS